MTAARWTGRAAGALTFAMTASVAAATPTGAQTAAYEAMRQEADAYERGAEDYETTIATIVTLHYEEKKRALLGKLDREIGAEKAQLRQARQTAIRRLEEFVATHSGSNADPEATPDAMYRLAALYEERARADEDPSSDLATQLRGAIALYKRVAREFPRYRELAAIHYFLGHALADAHRTAESQQVWRSLVCHNHYPYPVATEAKDPDRDVVAPLPQDHDARFWRSWRSAYGSPEALRKGPKSETTFEDPYPSDCQAIAQPEVVGREPRYVAEVWWRIGDWEFDQDDVGGGVVEQEPFAVWDYDRAASAYGHALELREPPIHGIALYKHAWTLFKQQRYEAAVREFVRLLRYTDEQQKLTGDFGADFRQEAYTYIAGSLDNLDFTGPAPDAPSMARPDVLDTARSPAEAEAKLRVAIDRVQDPHVIPQNEPWTIRVYGALAEELRGISQPHDALAVYQLMLDRWPLDASAPDTQNAIAEVDELLARQTKVGDERRGYEQQVLVARTALSHYVGDTPWVDANRDDPTAIRRAEELVRTGLRGAAATHTRNAQAAVASAERAGDAGDAARLAAYALDEYRLAATGWRGVVQQLRPDAPDSYRSRYFLADAMHEEVRLSVSLHRVDPASHPAPSAQEIAAATEAAVTVRDSDEDDTFVDNAGLFVVDLADVERDLASLDARTGPRLDGSAGDQRVVVDPIPGVLGRSIAARDEYVRRVTPERDVRGGAVGYAMYAAEQMFLYGHFEEARDRLEPIYRGHCGKDALGYEAWKRLIVMSNLSKDAARSRALAEAEKARSCAWTEAQNAEEKAGVLTDRVLEAEAFDRGRALYDKGLWEQACAANEAAAGAAPAGVGAPDATRLAASACAQAGKPRKAIELYELFVARHGSDDALGHLEPEVRKRRLQELATTYDAVSSAYYGLFAFEKAAASFARVAVDVRMDAAHRVTSARNAMVLYSSLGDRDRMSAMHGVLMSPEMHISADRRIEADYLEASFDYEQWVASPGDAAVRQRAVEALAKLHDGASKRPEGARYALEAAHRISRMMRAGGNPGLLDWQKRTVTDWEYFASQPAAAIPAAGAPYGDYGAEADFALVDSAIRDGFDLATGHRRYRGTVTEVRAQVDRDLDEVSRKWKPLLDRVAQRYGSFEWAAAATAREGSLYDAIRTSLDLAVPAYLTTRQKAAFDRLEAVARQLDAAGHTADADTIRQRAEDAEQQLHDAWRAVKDRYLDVCTRRMVGKYATAAVVTRAHAVENGAVQSAIARLAFYTDYLGDDVLRPYVQATPDPADASRTLEYVDGEFLRWRSGVRMAAPVEGMPSPLPAAP